MTILYCRPCICITVWAVDMSSICSHCAALNTVSQPRLSFGAEPRPATALNHCVCLMQGCVEIVYITVQTILFVIVVYWMAWFQIDAGMCPDPCCTLGLHLSILWIHLLQQELHDFSTLPSQMCLAASSLVPPVHCCSLCTKLHSLLRCYLYTRALQSAQSVDVVVFSCSRSSNVST